MATRFSINVNNIPMDIISMNAHQPKLFQLWVVIDGHRKRFHLKQSEEGRLVFAMRDDCPAELLALENEITGQVLANFTIER